MSDDSAPILKSPTPHSASEMVSSSPRPRHFISRSDGTLTPLIAVDELPSSMRLVGVPVLLTNADTQGMVSLGVQTRSQGHYIVETVDQTLGSASVAPAQLSAKVEPSSVTSGTISLKRSSFPDMREHIQGLKSVSIEHNPDSEMTEGFKDNNTASATGSPTTNAAEDIEDGDSGGHNVEKWRRGISSAEKTQAAIDAVLAANDKSIPTDTDDVPKGHRVYNPTTPGVFGKKIYCTHWLRTGECDFIQQGCMYKHEMPDDQTLATLNFRGVPRWYREAHGAPVPPRPANLEGPWRPLPAKTAARAIEDAQEAQRTSQSPFNPNYTGNIPAEPQYNMNAQRFSTRQYNPGHAFTGGIPGPSSGAASQPYTHPIMSHNAHGFPSQMGPPRMPAYNGPPPSSPHLARAPPYGGLPGPFVTRYASPASQYGGDAYNPSVTSSPLERGMSNYKPLTPSSPHRTIITKKAAPFPQPKPSVNPANLYDGAPMTPVPIHKRMFVPSGESPPVLNPTTRVKTKETSSQQEKFDALLKDKSDPIPKDKSKKPVKARGSNGVGNLVDLGET